MLLEKTGSQWCVKASKNLGCDQTTAKQELLALEVQLKYEAKPTKISKWHLASALLLLTMKTSEAQQELNQQHYKYRCMILGTGRQIVPRESPHNAAKIQSKTDGL